MNYFTIHYIEGSYTPVLWNHYDTKDFPRTNNHVEGFNLKLKKFYGCSHPNIFKAVEEFQKQELSAFLRYKRH